VAGTKMRVTLINGEVFEEYVTDEQAKRMYAWDGRENIRLARVVLLPMSVATVEVREPGSDEWRLAWKRR
jgi:hypothetical protein